MFHTIKNNSESASEFRQPDAGARPKVLVIFGTRPEAIKLAPVINELKSRNFPIVVVSSGQHTDLLAPFLNIFNLETNYDLQTMRADQTPTEAAARILSSFDVILEKEKPEIVLVQGDTTTAFAGAFAAFNRRIKIGHVEAGLRSGNPQSPFPEEMNRRLISQTAAFNFAATERNKNNLIAENIPENRIYKTGNTIVDALHSILDKLQPSCLIEKTLNSAKGKKIILLTTHRRESFGETMSKNLLVLRQFVENHDDAHLIFPVHPNPNVRRATEKMSANHQRITLLEPLDYVNFVCLMKAAWLIISDSGGVQEEAPSLGKPLFILRENTERPEAIESGVAKLVGENALEESLEAVYRDESWIRSVKKIRNPFGDGSAAKRIVGVLEKECFAAQSVEMLKPQVA